MRVNVFHADVGSTAAHCQKFKHGRSHVSFEKDVQGRVRTTVLLQELADLEEQVKEDEEDKKESKSILKKCTDRLKNQENLVWKLKEKSVLEQKECEDKKKVASKETLDALKVCFYFFDLLFSDLLFLFSDLLFLFSAPQTRKK